MTYQWVSIGLLLAASVILPPLALWWLSQRSRLSPLLHSLTGVVNTFISTISVLFALNLVFVCNEIWQNRELAKAAMSREAEALRNIGRISTNIPERGGVLILEAAREYLDAVRQFDFPNDKVIGPTTSLSSLNDSSLPAVIKLSDAILNGETLDKIHPAIRPLLLAQLSTVRDKRLERVALVNIEPNFLKWSLLVFLEFMALITIAMIHIKSGRPLLVASFIYLSSINPILFVLYASQSPFSGIDPLNGSALAAASDRLKSMEEIYKKK